MVRMLNAESPDKARPPARRQFCSKASVYPKRLLSKVAAEKSVVGSVKAPVHPTVTKPKRARPGSKAVKKIHAAQKRSTPIIPWAVAMRFVKEAALEIQAEEGWERPPRVRPKVVSLLQDHLEDVAVDFFSNAMLIMLAAKVKTLRPVYISTYTKVSTIHRDNLS